MMQVDLHRLPPPGFEVPPGFTRAVFFGPRPLSELSRPERIQLCYWHAALRHIHNEALTNASLRERLCMTEDTRSLASRYIREAVKAGVIRPLDPDAGPKYMKYLPWWA